MLQEELERKIAISIENDSEGIPRIRWSVDGLSGIDVLGLMAQTIFDMYDQLFDAPDRPYFEGENSRACIEYDCENVSIAYRPEGNIHAAQGLTMAALAALCKRASQEDFDPLEGILGAIMSPITDRPYKEGGSNGGSIN